MGSLRNYWWMIITIPTLAFLIYIISRPLTPKDKSKKMVGMSILAIIFGILQILYFISNKGQLNITFLFFGICWIILGSGRLIYDYRRTIFRKRG